MRMRRLAMMTLGVIFAVAWAGEGIARTVVLGEFNITLLTLVSSAIPSSTPIQCSITVSVFGTGTPVTDSIIEKGTALATISGSTASCQILIPYRWILWDSGDTVNISYSVTATDGNGIGRTTSSSYNAIAVPANNATTTYTISTRL